MVYREDGLRKMAEGVHGREEFERRRLALEHRAEQARHATAADEHDLWGALWEADERGASEPPIRRLEDIGLVRRIELLSRGAPFLAQALRGTDTTALVVWTELPVEEAARFVVMVTEWVGAALSGKDEEARAGEAWREVSAKREEAQPYSAWGLREIGDAVWCNRHDVAPG
jgi:hypothetical protein